MQTNLIKIGNSQGIRLPAPLLKQCDIRNRIELEVIDNNIIAIKAANHTPRKGWGEAFQKMHEKKDDTLLINDYLEGDQVWEW